ncbi:odorant receptor 13a-like isoform X2 [Odontomachus brunneus]|uniref:odorant receptor 13a-like isoform X2 n=1 Tax=Odontomachus brunneus TaxID=486640 RepID=UPI0013F193A5|nr:odorant receptor 13a-like isoform X2 [Odontomachus brunneus]
MVVTSTICPSLQIGLRAFAVWPGVPYADVRRLIYVLSLVVIQYFQYLFIYVTFKYSQLQNLLDSIPSTMYYTLTAVKLITLWKYDRVIREILATIESDWRECVKVDQHLHIMTTKANISSFCAHGLLALNSIAGLLYFGGENAIAIVHMLKGNNVTSRPFPVRVVFPSAAEQSPVYELLVFILFLHGMSTIIIVNVLSGVILTLVFHACGQIEIICQQLKNMSEKMMNYGSPRFSTGMLVDRHNKVITFAENVDKLFSFIALIQVFGNTLVVCFLGLFLITSHNKAGVGLFKSVFAYAGITAEIFTFCFVGEYLSLKSRSLGDAGYETLWYNMAPSHCKDILFIIMRSQKQLTMTAGGMMDLSLEAFTSIMKASASYMSVLNAMY